MLHASVIKGKLSFVHSSDAMVVQFPSLRTDTSTRKPHPHAAAAHRPCAPLPRGGRPRPELLQPPAPPLRERAAMEAALQAMQELELQAVEDSFAVAGAGHAKALDSLFKRRQELVSGKALPTSEELAGFEPQGGAAAAAGGGKSPRGVPQFWLNALCNHDGLAEEISSRDRLALSHCTSIKAVHPPGGGPPTLEMAFAANPFFTNSTLRRCLGDAGALEVTTAIDWKDTKHKLTVKEVRKGGGGKKGKKGGKAKGGADDGAGAGVRLKACPSFFRFFAPDTTTSARRGALHDPAALVGGDSDASDGEGDAVRVPRGASGRANSGRLLLADVSVVPPPFQRAWCPARSQGGAAKSAKARADAAVMAALLGEVLPRAAALFMAGPLQSLSDEDDDDFAVVSGGGSHEDLPPPVQAVLAALRHNQAQLDELAAQRQRQRAEATAAGDKLRQELAVKRRALLLPPGASEPSVPRFWLRVLRSADAAALAISSRDAAVLASLADVRLSITAGAGSSREAHGKLELEFCPNPYLAPGCARVAKDYTFELGAGGEPFLRSSRVAAPPTWASPARDPTHRAGADGKARPAASLFQLLRPGGGKYAFNLAGPEREVQAEASALETELLMALHGELLLRAGAIFARGAVAGWPDDDTPSGDAAAWERGGQSEDEADDSDDGSGDEGEAAHRAAARHAKAKAGASRLSARGWALIALVLLVIAAQFFVFLDMVLWGSSGGGAPRRAAQAARDQQAAAATTSVEPRCLAPPTMAGAGGGVVLSGFLPCQHFTGNPLDRHSDLLKRFQATFNPDSEVSLIVVAGRDVVVRPVGPDSSPGVAQDLQALLLRTDDPELELQGEQLLLRWTPSDGAESIPLPLYLLGLDVQERWTFAVDISPARELFMDFLRNGCDLRVSLKDLRLLLPTLSLDAAAIAGQAVALSQWHQMHLFCPRCGSETLPSEGGARRRCTAKQQHKLYPRTDPVVIMLVESPDGHRALLGRSAKSTPGMYTCLSGFIDPCEGIEEAVRREVMEEARVQVSDVQIVGTQPWPIGRYGSCELMIGCVARATSYEVMLNPAEMEDVQWYDRAELRAAVGLYGRAGPLPEIQKRSWSSLGFFIPPPFAVAHHLIAAWAGRDEPWFTPIEEEEGGGGGGGGSGGGGGGGAADGSGAGSVDGAAVGSRSAL
ncbi:NUDT19 [Scenedesmus sp. PABB004]|nr:NUDT19 [Scenedesmus sp. PABB004]